MRLDFHKIENYSSTNLGQKFPAFSTLSNDQAKVLQGLIKERLGLTEEGGKTLVAEIQARSEVVPDVNAEEEGFCLGKVLSRLGLPYKESMYLNWRHFDSVDVMLIKDLSEHFSDVWYPGSDDLDIFDATCEWFLSISHFGELRLLQLE